MISFHIKDVSGTVTEGGQPSSAIDTLPPYSMTDNNTARPKSIIFLFTFCNIDSVSCLIKTYT